MRLFAFALTLAVASITATAFFSERLRLATEAESRQLQGADLTLVSDLGWRQEILDEAARRGLWVTRVATFPSMVFSTDREEPRTRLVEVKAAEAEYPLRGEMRVSNQPGGEGMVAHGAPPPGSVWIEPRLGRELGLATGLAINDEIQLGNLVLRVAGYILLEPDRGMNFISLSPRLMLNLSDLPATGLTQEGARLAWRSLFAGEREAVAGFSAWLSGELIRGERIEEGGREETRRAIRQGERFFGFTSLLTVMLSAVAIFLSARRFAANRVEVVALLRCLGISRRAVIFLHFGELSLLGILAGLVGAACGFILHFLLAYLLDSFLKINLPPPGWLPVVEGVALAVLLILAFVLPSLLALRQISPLAVIRRETPPLSFAPMLSGLSALATFAALIFWLTGDIDLSQNVLIAFLVAFLGFLIVARGSLFLLARFFRSGINRAGFIWRHAALRLERQAWANSFSVMALALGLMTLFLLTVVQSELAVAWNRAASPDTPNRFLINIQANQKNALEERLRGENVRADMAPMIRGRLTHIDGLAVDASSYPDDERARRLVERQFNLSWRPDLPAWNRLVKGRWFLEGGAEASVEEGLAKTLGIRPGATLVFDLEGRTQEVRVTSLRSLEWNSMRANFFVLLSPGLVEDAPVSYLANFYLLEEREAALNRILADFPNLTLIDLSALLAQVRDITGKLSQAVAMLCWLTLASGVIVLYSALYAAAAERQDEIAISRALGASRSQIRQSLLAELVLLGALSGIVAGAGAILAGDILAWKLFDLHLPGLWHLPFIGGFLGSVLTLAAGHFCLAPLLKTPPFAVLRKI